MTVAKIVTTNNDKGLLFTEVLTHCPGCDIRHRFTIEVHQGDYRRGDGSVPPTWQWDGNLDSPTFNPSLLAYSTVHRCASQHTFTYCDQEFEDCGHRSHGYVWEFPDGRQRTFKVYEEKPSEAVVRTFGEMSDHPISDPWGNCHSFLHNGVWQFLGDSAHHLAGQNVPMVPIPGLEEGDWL